MSEVPFKIRWLSGGVPDHWQIVEPRRIFKLVKEPERPGDVHLTPSQKYGVLPQEEYMKITGARVVQNLSGTQMQHVEPGDFISHLRTFQGGLELATIPGKVSPAYTVLRPTEAVYPGFFKHVLKSPGYVSQIASVTDQLRDGQTMRFNEFNLTWLPLPPLEEQKRIADELDRELAEIDEFIADATKLQHLIEEREAAELEKILIKDATEFVEIRRLKPRCVSGTSVNAAPWPASKKNEFGVLKTGVVSKGFFDPSQNKSVLEENEISRLSVPVKADTIIVNRANSPELVGSAAYIEEDYPNLFLSDKLWQMDFEDTDNEYIAAVMQTRFFKEQVRQRCVGASSSMQNLSYQDFLSIKVPINRKILYEPIQITNISSTHIVNILLDKKQAIIQSITNPCKE